MAHLSLSLLGPFLATLDGEPISGLEAAKTRALLAYLAVEAHRHPDGQPRPHLRIALAELLWPERSDRAALANLRTALARLRQAIGDRLASGRRDTAHPEGGTSPFLLVKRETIQFNLASDHWLDVDVFRAQVETAEAGRPAHERLEEAVALYRGDFLEGLGVRGSPGFEDWALLLREQLQRQALAALHRLVAHYESSGAVARACEFAWRQVDLAPWEEEAHRGLMRLLALSGQRAAALAQYEACRRALRAELDVEPSEETTRLYERIRDGELAQETGDGRQPVAGHATLPLASPALREPAPTPQPSAPPVVASAEGKRLGERRVVTALAAVVAVSAEGGGPVDAELRAEVMRRLLPVLSREIDRHGGEVDRYRDDGLIALFGASATHEDDPERAVLAALAMQEAFQPQVAEWVAREQIGLSLNVGVGSGEVVAGSVGDRAQVWADSVVERALGLAEPAQGFAQRGVVQVAEETYRRVAPLFDWQPLGEGQEADPPVPAHRALARRATPGKGRGIEGLASPLVGRETELQALREAMERLRSGIGGIVTVVGEAGIGKSRLVAECWDERAPLHWIEGCCLSYATGSAYHLWFDMLDGWLGVAPDASPTAVQQVLRERVLALCPDRLADVYPYLARMMALPLEEELDAGLRGLDAESLRFLTFRAVETLLARAAAERPLAVLCEDLHWADPTSLALLEHLLALTDRAPITFVCLFRPQTEGRCWQLKERATRDYPHAHTDLWLKPLSPAESLTLVGNLLHIEELPPALRARILDRAEGNPFYVEEILRSLIDAAADGGAGIVHDPATHRWRATQDVADLPIPDTLHGVLSARIDRLPGETKRVLQLASVIGRAFAYPILSAIHSPPAPLRSEEVAREPETGIRSAPVDPDLLSHLVALERAQLVREQARLPEREYVFEHVLTQEAAYASLLRRERRTAHRQVAEALERLYPERIEEQLGLLAHHWERAGESARAIDCLRRAGEQAEAQYAAAEAFSYYDRALALVPKTDLAAQYDLLMARSREFGRPYTQAADMDLAALEHLAETLADPYKKAEVALRRAERAFAVDDVAAGTAAAREAIETARAIGAPRIEAQAYFVLGRAGYFTDRDWTEARQHYEQALAVARTQGLRSVEAQILRRFGMQLALQANPAAGKEALERAFYLQRELGSKIEQGRVLTALSVAHLRQGNLQEARQCCEQGLQLCQATGNRFDEAWAFEATCWIAISQGEYAEAKLFAERALVIFRQLDWENGECWSLADLGRIHWYLGDCDAATAYLQRGLEISAAGIGWKATALTCLGLISHRQGDDQAALEYGRRALSMVLSPDRRRYLPLLGYTSIGLGDLDRAADVYGEALTLWERTELRALASEPLAGLAHVALCKGNRAQALAHVDLILGYLKDPSALGEAWDPFWIYMTCVRILRANQDPRADEVLDQAYKRLQARAAKIEDQDLRRSYLENVPAHREIIAAWQQASHP